MVRCTIIYLLLLIICHTNSATPDEHESTTQPPDKLHLEKSQPYPSTQQPSLFSRLASWIFPQGEDRQDLVTAEGHHGGPQYLPPPSKQQSGGCNPCNQAPWIPVASNLGHKTVLNFVPPSSSQQYGPPVFKPKPEKLNYGLPPKPIYGPPLKLRQPVGSFGPPKHVVPTFAPSIENLRPPLPPQNYGPPKTYLKPVQDYGSSIGMRPPPIKGGVYHSLPPTLPSYQYGEPSQHIPPPPPPPSDSYGTPVSGPNSEFQLRPEFLPIDPLPLPSDTTGFDVDRPIPLPNLSSRPVLPLRNAQNFHGDDIQVIPSIKVVDYVASVDHPINVIQSPLVEVAVKDDHDQINQDNEPRLSENPIVVDDTHTAASAINVTYQNDNFAEDHNLPVPSSTPSYRSEGHEELLNSEFIQQFILQQSGNVQNSTFTPPPIDYSKWQPSFTATVSPSMVPPPPPAPSSTWLYPVPKTTTKKPKQIQIIVPYINNKQPTPFNYARPAVTPSYTTLLPVYTPPPSSQESLWTKFADDFRLAESKKVTATAFTPPPSTTQVYNIKDLLKDTNHFQSSEKLPYDVISLQNNIDDWTQQEFSKSYNHFQSVKSTTKFVPSKKIPNEYFTTQPYIETTTTHFDYEPASSNKNENKHLNDDIDSNLIYTEPTTEKTLQSTVSAEQKEKKSLWDVTSVTVSPLTKEKVYIVTPQPVNNEKTTTPVTAWSLPPRIQIKNATTTATSYATPKFLVRVDPENKESREKLQQSFSPLTVVFSEWPHLINNLQTTTRKPGTHHPLFGLMDLSAYTPPPNSTVQTISGHSKVVSVVTPSSVTEKKAKASTV